MFSRAQINQKSIIWSIPSNDQLWTEGNDEENTLLHRYRASFFFCFHSVHTQHNTSRPMHLTQHQSLAWSWHTNNMHGSRTECALDTASSSHNVNTDTVLTKHTLSLVMTLRRQHTWSNMLLSLPWSTPAGHRPHSPVNDKNELQSIQTSAWRANGTSLPAYAHTVVNCIRGLTKNLLLTAKPALDCTIRRWLSATALGPKRRNLKSCKDTNSPSTTMGSQISNKICFERRTVKTLVLNCFWIKHWVCSKTYTHNRKEEKFN